MAHDPGSAGSAETEPQPAAPAGTSSPDHASVSAGTSSPDGRAVSAGGGRWRRAVVPLVVAVVAVAVVAIVAVSYAQHVDKHRDETWAALNEIARLKAGEVALWVRERDADAGLLLDDAGLARNCRLWFVDDRPEEFRRDSVPFLESIARRYGYTTVAVVDAVGTVRYSVSGRSVDDLPTVEALLMEGGATGEVATSDLYLGEDGTAYIDWLVPLFDESGGGRGPLVGGVLLRADPARYLYPLLSSWPGSDPTAETLLVRRDGRDVVFLNPLRFRRGSALRLRIPADTPELSAARAVTGASGVEEGVDYRGARVLAAYRPVPGTDWAVVAKVDTDDVYAPITREAWLVVLLTAALLGAGGLTVGLVWRRRELQAARLEVRVASERAALSEHYELLTRHASDVMLLLDQELRIVECNDRTADVYGYPHEELLTMSLTDLLAPDADVSGGADLAGC